DFRETTGRFVLMYWYGYAGSNRFDLQRHVAELTLEKTLTEREPFFDNANRRLYLPLYFVNALESVIVFESDSPMELTAPRVEIAKMVSKFVGMMMSSNRLPFNQQGLVDLDDLNRARQIQLTYLPANNFETDRYELYGYNESSAYVGGDYFDYFRLRDHSMQC